MRNYFNRVPTKLRILDRDSATKERQKFVRSGESGPSKHFSLSNAVYKDDGKIEPGNVARMWFQMDPLGTKYHYKGGTVRNGAVRPQTTIPIFKLISPDGSHGSCEVIIENFQKPYEITGVWGEPKKVIAGSRYIGGAPGCNYYTKLSKCNVASPSSPKWVLVKALNLVVKHPVYKGSYNYAETVEEGMYGSGHNEADVKTHIEHKEFYVDPVDMWSSLKDRVFPERDNISRLLTSKFSDRFDPGVLIREALEYQETLDVNEQMSRPQP